MAFRADTETVALALRELSLSRGDQDRLSEFISEYFTSEDYELSSGKYKHTKHKHSNHDYS